MTNGIRRATGWLTCDVSLLALLPLLVAFAGPVAAQERVRFEGAAWDLRGDIRVGEHLGRSALLVRAGLALRPGLEFENGTIEFDVATSGHRSFTGVRLRMSEGGNFEDVYLRPHNAGRWDALQYTPVYNGVSAWQLYSTGYNANVPIPTDSWIHVRLVVAGSRAEVYVGGGDAPDLVVTDLKRGETRGRVAVWSFFPAGEPEGFYPVAFSNIEIRPDDRPGEYVERDLPPPDSGYVTRWRISSAFAPSQLPLRELPDRVLTQGESRIARSEPEGFINLARYVSIPEGADRGTVLARVTLDSDRERIVPLHFGFSDRVSVFLNGRLVYTGDNSYRSRSQRYLGVMTVDNDALYLPLRAGANELAFAVTEAFGGWGLVARLPDRDGVRIRPARAADPGS